jgi:hypothetical protein
MTNGHITPKRKKVNAARERVLEAAREKGVITNTEARKIGRWEQCWYHLQAMCKQGLLKHTGYNEWVPTSRR